MRDYSLDALLAPSVTELMPKQDFFISDEYLEICRKEGTERHSMIKMYFDTGDTFNDSYLINIDRWYQDAIKTLGPLVCYEEALYYRAKSIDAGISGVLNNGAKVEFFEEKILFKGTPDAIFQKGVVDFKRSPSVKRRHALQLAGYYILAVKNSKISTYTENWWIVHGEECKVKKCYQDNAEDHFMKLVNIFWLQKDVEKYMSEVRK